MKKWMLLALGLAVLGCSGSENKATTPGEAPGKSAAGSMEIAVIPKGSTHEFWKSVKAGAEAAGKELGVTVTWKGPLKESDREEQIKVVEDFTTRKVAAIVLAPLDDSALRVPVMNAKNAGIQVVIIDSALKDADDLPFVATDNFKGGQMAGERMKELLGAAGGKVIMLRYQEGSASTMEREAGFLDALKDAPGITILSDNQYGGATTETAQTASENLLGRFADVQGIYTPNESTTFGMLRALEGAGKAGQVKFVGFDASSSLIDGLKADKIHGLIVQNPYNMGYLGVKTAVAKVRSETTETRIDTGATLVTKENLAEPEIAKLIAPPTP